MTDPSLAFRDWIRGQWCCACMQRKGKPHHVIAIGRGVDSSKPDPKHFSCIPLCDDCHTLSAFSIHRLGRQKFDEYWTKLQHKPFSLFEQCTKFLIKWLTEEQQKEQQC